MSFLARGADELAAHLIRSHENVFWKRSIRASAWVEEERRVAVLAPMHRSVHMAREHKPGRVAVHSRDQVGIAAVASGGARGGQRLLGGA